MKVLVNLYDKVLRWSEHKYAPRYLAVISFIESSFCPIYPDIMLAPMSLAKPNKAFYYAGIATIFSVLGGILGYFIGVVAFDPVVAPLLKYFGYQESYNVVLEWFNKWGFWAILLAGSFTPIPYKLCTIGAGVLHFNFAVFLFASIVGRGTRFFLVSGLLCLGGEQMVSIVRKMVSKLGWAVILGIVVWTGLRCF